MPQPYNLTNITNAQNMGELLKASNELSEGVFGLGILVLVFIISYTAATKYGAPRGFAVGSVLTAITAIFLNLLSLIPNTHMYGSFLLVAVAMVWLRLGE